MFPLKTLLTEGKVAELILPGRMNAKDFDLLSRWVGLLTEAYGFEIAKAIVETVTAEEPQQGTPPDRKKRANLVQHIDEILRLRNEGMTIPDLAEKFGGSIAGMTDLIRRKKFAIEFTQNDGKLKLPEYSSKTPKGIYFKDFVRLLNNGAVIELRKKGNDEYFTVNGVKFDAYREFSQAVKDYGDCIRLVKINENGIVYRIDPIIEGEEEQS